MKRRDFLSFVGAAPVVAYAGMPEPGLPEIDMESHQIASRFRTCTDGVWSQPVDLWLSDWDCWPLIEERHRRRLGYTEKEWAGIRRKDRAYK